MDNNEDRRNYFDCDEEELAGINRKRCAYEEEIDYNHNKERDRFAEVLEEAFNEGYKKGYCDGYEKGYQKGYCEGYKQGVKDGYEKAKKDVLGLMMRKRCCCKCCKRRCQCC